MMPFYRRSVQTKLLELLDKKLPPKLMSYYTDFEEAFDNVDHLKLLVKLHEIGFSGTVPVLFVASKALCCV